ncbi:MAG: N-acetylmuramoyl-L-alanine amidase [Chloroflexia bacterium]|nr:N-acetylmuramoyl-L-alanine amidase [Chloroflexia bacterium]
MRLPPSLLVLVVLAIGGVAIVAATTMDTPAGAEIACPVRSASVVLDPGHGGEDSGAVNGTLRESDLNLDIANRTAALVRAAGHEVALTRDDDTFLTNSERGYIANACRATVFVSIHLNSFPEPEPNYVMTFWGIDPKDVAFTRHMIAALHPTLDSAGTGLGNGDIDQFETGSLLRATMPGTLVETVFLSNPAEAALLGDGTGRRQQQIAGAIAAGIVTWLGR